MNTPVMHCQGCYKKRKSLLSSITVLIFFVPNFNVTFCRKIMPRFNNYTYKKPYTSPKPNFRKGGYSPVENTSEHKDTTEGLPSSPQYTCAEDYYKIFDDAVMKEYNISSSKCSTATNCTPGELPLPKVERTQLHKKCMAMECSQLLCEFSINLNNSGTKILKLGIDVYRGFEPVVKIEKNGTNRGAYFSNTAFREFLSKVEDISETLFLCCAGSFELYLGYVTLRKLLAMGEFLNQKLQCLDYDEIGFNEFLKKTVDVLDRRHQNTSFIGQTLCDVTYKDLTDCLHSSTLIMTELVHTFPYFVISEVENYMKNYDDRFLYK